MRLAILDCHPGAELVERFTEQSQHAGLGKQRTAIEIDSADQRFHRVCLNRRSIRTPVALLTFTKTQKTAELHRAGNPQETVVPNKGSPVARQIAFTGLRETAIKRHSNHAVQNRIAEKFEPLVVLGAGTPMGKGTLEQRRIGEAMSKRFLQFR